MRNLLFVFIGSLLAITVMSQTVHNLNSQSTQGAGLGIAGFSAPQELSREAKASRMFAINPTLQKANSVSVGDIVTLQLFEGKTYTATVNRTVTDVNGNFTLTLKLPDYPYAFAVITTGREGKSLVTVSIPELGQSFGSRFGSNADSYLIEIDESKIEPPKLGNDAIHLPQETGLFETGDNGNVQNRSQPGNGSEVNCGPVAKANPDMPAVIDLLVVYTPATTTLPYVTQRGGIGNVISTMMATSNLCFSNSQTGITLRLAHAEQVNYTEPVPYNMQTTLARLRDPSDGYMDNVHALRKQYNADLVQLLTVENDWGGYGYYYSESGNVNTGFTVVHVGDAGGTYPISAHEIGHNMGLGHAATMINPGWGVFGYSFGWTWEGTTYVNYGGQNTRRKGTVMSYWNGKEYADGINALPVPYFANPNVNYEGPTGHATQADAARSLREMKHVIAYYSDKIANFPAAPTNIVVSNPANNGATFSWDACAGATSYRVCLPTGGGSYSYYTTPNTTYTVNNASWYPSTCTEYEIFIMAYNSCGDGVRGQTVTFKTRCATDPTVTASATTGIMPNSATLHKTVTANGSAITSEGFMYKEMTGGTWQPSTDGNLTRLKPDTEYKYYAYATTANGTINSLVQTFNTFHDVGQVWNLTATMKATLNNGVLTVSTTLPSEAMPDFAGFPPWSNDLDKIQLVIIEEKVTSIGAFAFFSCINLTSITFPNSLNIIGDYAFYFCVGLTSVSLPESLIFIGEKAFSCSWHITSIVIPHLVAEIGTSAFEHCLALSSIHVDARNSTFSSDSNGVLYNKNKTILHTFPGGKKGEFTVPSSVLEIKESAFAVCIDLTTVKIPASVVTIGNSAFINCQNLTSISIPVSVTSIGGLAFMNCENLQKIYLEWPSPLSISNNVFDGVNINAATLHVPAGTKALYQADPVWGLFGTIIEQDTAPCDNPTDSGTTGALTWTLCPDGKLTISGNGMMPDYEWNATPWNDYLNDITNVIIEDGVTKIGANAFVNCQNMISITISNSVTIIGKSAFFGSGITSVTIPDNVSTIGGSAFEHCNRLNSITIPKSVTSIEFGAFCRCDSLNTINVDESNPAFLSINGILFSKDKATLVAYPAGNKNNSYIIPSSVAIIGRFAFSGSSNLTSITIPNSVSTIYQAAFSECKGLTSVTIPNSVTTIGNAVFSNCTNLHSINVDAANPAHSSIDGILFNNDQTALVTYPAGKTNDSYTIPVSVTSIYYGSFWDSKLTSIIIPASVTSIEPSAFISCNKLTDVTVWWVTPLFISDNVFQNTNISEGTLHVPAGTRDIYKTYPVWQDFGTIIEQGGAPTWSLSPTMDAVLDNNGTLTISTSKSAEAMPDWDNPYTGAQAAGGMSESDKPVTLRSGTGPAPWANNSAIKSVVIDANVTSIGRAAFDGLSNLTSIAIPATVEKIGTAAFTGCQSLQSVTIPASVQEIERNAFIDMSNLSLTVAWTASADIPSLPAGESFFMNTTIQTLFVPAGTEELYRVEDNWKEFTVKPKPAIMPGDVNGDGTVNGLDITALLADFGKTGGAVSNPKADVNEDGVVNGLDITALLANFGKTTDDN